ncbi:MAG: (deoxy)nucleoside triphosphate pyrophosphohydrolase [Rhodobacteraceae bacterium]|nr:(deoxy)nucleoside triphosphate pyrophosphohydrolase [Paracoccaceae bacterium]
MTIVLVAAVALLDRDSRVLIARRTANTSFAGLWEFPGGKVKSGETPEDALMREMDEELGIGTWSSCLAPLSFASHSYEEFHLLMPLYACRKWTGMPLARIHSELKWVRPERLADFPMPPANNSLKAMLRDWL